MSKSRSYYTTVERYHDLAEASHANQMFDAGLIAPFIADGMVLDVAAGSGFNAQLFSIPPDHYVATDFSHIGLMHVVEKGRGVGVVADAGLLSFRDASFESLLCSWSLEHCEDPETVLEEMLRVMKPGGRIIIWGPNWDNIFRRDFPQLSHRSVLARETVRWRIFLKMLRNEFLPFRYSPYITDDVAAFADPDRYVAHDYDAVHCVLCQETVKWFQQHGGKIVFLGDFADMTSYVHNSGFIRMARFVLKPLLPILRRIPLFRWFVIRFPLVVEIP